MNTGKIDLRLSFFACISPFFSCFFMRMNASANVIGMMASVLVSLTIVAYSRTAPCVPWSVSQVDAVAVTEDVSFTAVPANNPKPVFDKPSMEPNAGNVRAAIILNRKMTEIAYAISSSFDPMTGAVAAMAEPPQIEDPTPISVALFAGIFNSRCMRNATMSDVVMVERMIGREDNPTLLTVVRFSPNPNKITAYCSTFFDTKLMPLCRCDLSLRNSVMIAPASMAITGAPMTSNALTCFTSSHAGIAISRHKKIPFPFFFMKSIAIFSFTSIIIKSVIYF